MTKTMIGACAVPISDDNKKANGDGWKYDEKINVKQKINRNEHKQWTGKGLRRWQWTHMTIYINLCPNLMENKMITHEWNGFETETSINSKDICRLKHKTNRHTMTVYEWKGLWLWKSN